VSGAAKLRADISSAIYSSWSATGTAGNSAAMLLLLILLAALVVRGGVLAVVVIKWLFILAIVAALIWVIAFFRRGVSSRV